MMRRLAVDKGASMLTVGNEKEPCGYTLLFRAWWGKVTPFVLLFLAPVLIETMSLISSHEWRRFAEFCAFLPLMIIVLIVVESRVVFEIGLTDDKLTFVLWKRRFCVSTGDCVKVRMFLTSPLGNIAGVSVARNGARAAYFLLWWNPSVGAEANAVERFFDEVAKVGVVHRRAVIPFYAPEPPQRRTTRNEIKGVICRVCLLTMVLALILKVLGLHVPYVNVEMIMLIMLVAVVLAQFMM